VLAAFDDRPGLRFAELQVALPASRQPLRDALLDLVEAGIVRRKGGYGHPLRPEYLVAASGERLAAAAALLRRRGEDEGLEPLLARKWSLPVLAALMNGPQRFGDLARVLINPAPRALALALRHLEAADLIDRHVDDGRPPRAHYSLAMSPALRRALKQLLDALG